MGFSRCSQRNCPIFTEPAKAMSDSIRQTAGDQSGNGIQFGRGLALICAIVTSPGESCNESGAAKIPRLTMWRRACGSTRFGHRPNATTKQGGGKYPEGITSSSPALTDAIGLRREAGTPNWINSEGVESHGSG
jgi:hypothetical protein